MPNSPVLTKNQLKRIAQDLSPLGFSYTKKRTHDQVVELYEFLKSKGYDGNVDKASVTNFIYESDFTDEIMRAMDDQNLEKETQEWFQRLEPEEVPTKPAKQDRQEIYDFFQRFEPEEAPSKPSKEERQRRYEELINDDILTEEEYQELMQLNAEIDREENEAATNEMVTVDEGIPSVDLPLDRDMSTDLLLMVEGRIEDTFKTFFSNIQPEERWKIIITKTNGQTLEIPLPSEARKRIMDDIASNAIFGAFYEEGSHTITFSDTADDPITDWYFIHKITFAQCSPQEYKQLTGANNTRKYRKNKTTNGGFFQYKASNIPEPVAEVLLQCQIFTEENWETKSKEVLKDSCLVYAIKQSNPEIDVEEMKFKITDRYISMHKNVIEELANDYDLRINLTKINEEKYEKGKAGTHVRTYVTINKDGKRAVDINLFKEHYFAEFKTNVTKDYVEYMDVPDPKKAPNKRYLKGRWAKTTQSTHYLSSSNLVIRLWRMGKFKPLNYTDFLSQVAVERPDIANVHKLNYNYKGNTRGPRTIKTGKSEYSSIWYADTEAVTNTEYHEAFMVCCENKETKQCFIGRDCIKQFLDFLPDKSLVVFHNLKYDFNFIAKYGHILRGIKKGKKTYRSVKTWKGKRITFQDSLCMITAPIEKFPEMFGLKDISKEAFPYDFYTWQRLEHPIQRIDNTKLFFTNDEYKRFQAGCRESGATTDDITFDMWKYAQFYCERDVNILRLGHESFVNQVKEALNMNVFDYLTAPALANAYFEREVYQKNPKIKRFGGKVAAFIRQAIYGGRVMPAFNKRWHLKAIIDDFDAKALYPSAMHIMKIPLGAPKVWNSTVDWRKSDYCFLHVTFKPVTKHRAFPLFCDRTKDKNVWTDTFTAPLTMVLGKVFLEDIIAAYDLKDSDYTINRGYYWDEGVDTSINEVIEHVFRSRRELQDKGNPLEQIFKLIMNSSYGKTIQKPIEEELVYKRAGPEYNNYFYKNANLIDRAEKIAGSDIYEVHVRKGIDNTFNYYHIGAIILDYSKHIMNEVMTLAEDIGCRIYYQDTDSMHIIREDLTKLEAAFEEKYHRKLVGDEMGQFHSDFKGGDHAVESWILAKKVYLDKLDTGAYHIRMKGVCKEAIIAYNPDVEKTYRDLYNGKAVEFNLIVGKPKFIFTDDYCVTTNHKFIRKIQLTNH